MPAFSGYGPDPLAARLNAAEAAALITVDGTTRKGKRVPMKDTADAALESAEGVEHLIVIAHDGGEVTMKTGWRWRMPSDEHVWGAG